MDNHTEPLPGGVWRIEVASQTNAYLVARDGVGDAAGLVLVDTGTAASGPRLVRSIRLLGFDPTRLEEVLLTHWHASHAGSAARLASSSAHPVLRAGAEDTAIASGLENPLRRAGLGVRLQRSPALPAHTSVEPLEPNTEPLPGMRVVAAPGRTSGHRAFWFERTGLLVAGDAVHHVLRFSAWPRAWTADPGAAAGTLRHLADLRPALIACGHGPPVRTEAATRLSRLADRASAAPVP